MHKRNVLAAVAAAGVIAAAGSAFTATSTIDEQSKTVGATSQSISGVAVTNVSYDWDSTNDTTNGVAFTIDKALSPSGQMTVKLSNPTDTTTGTCNTVDGTAYTCTFAPGVVNATSLSIVVN